jgi:hypothetical protein
MGWRNGCEGGEIGQDVVPRRLSLISVYGGNLLGGNHCEFWEYNNDLFSSSTAVIFHSGVAFGIGLCEIMGTVFACLLAKKFNSKFDRMV